MTGPAGEVVWGLPEYRKVVPQKELHDDDYFSEEKGAKDPAQADLAAALSGRFTVCNDDRRGRGGSGDPGGSKLEREFEDLQAVVEAAVVPTLPYDLAVCGHWSIPAAVLALHVQQTQPLLVHAAEALARDLSAAKLRTIEGVIQQPSTSALGPGYLRRSRFLKLTAISRGPWDDTKGSVMTGMVRGQAMLWFWP